MIAFVLPASGHSSNLDMPNLNVSFKSIEGKCSARAKMHAASKTTPLEKSLTLPMISRFQGTVHLPGSKSLSNRVLLLAALSKGTTKVNNLLYSEDVSRMLAALDALGVAVDSSDFDNVTVDGCSGPLPTPSDSADPLTLNLGNAGTAMRPLTAVLAASRTGHVVLDGTDRMRERPIQDLIDALKQLNVPISCSSTGCPPVNIKPRGLAGGTIDVSGRISSQYLSALLMAAPLANGPMRIRIKDNLVSLPYVDMTIQLMKKFGVQVKNINNQEFLVEHNQNYTSPGSYYVEGDASSASYFLAGAAITGGTITVQGCGRGSLQGDVHFADVLEAMGARVQWSENSLTVTGPASRKLKGIDVDMGDMPDVAMTLAVMGLFTQGPVAIRNVYNWRVKETERMRAIVTELRKLGARVEEGYDYCIVHPPTRLQTAAIETYDDHRMAMAFSLAACSPNSTVTILDPGCCKKTFPTYFDVLTSVTSTSSQKGTNMDENE